MYNVIKLPDNFLSHSYTQDEKDNYDRQLHEAVHGGLNEAVNFLTDKQKSKVDNWGHWPDREVRAAHDKVFGVGNDRITIPLDRISEEPVNHSAIMNMNHLQGTNTALQVASGLEKHGYHVKDYNKGLAIKVDEHQKLMSEGKPVRTYSIGKLMNKLPHRNDPAAKLADEYSGKTNAQGKQMNLNSAFNADPMRTAGKGDHVMVVTRNRYDVAGVSTNQNWNSCMNMVDGCNRRYLPNDIYHGTLAVFLAHKDHEANGELKPLARISAKRFDSDDGKDVKFVPEDSHYGNAHNTFKSAAKEFFDKHYPLEEKDYHMHPSLYADTGKKSIYKRDYSTLDNKSALETIHGMAGHHMDKISAINNGEMHDSNGDGWDVPHASDAAQEGAEEIKQRMRKMQPGVALHIGADSTIDHEKSGYGKFHALENIDYDDFTRDSMIANAYHDDHHNESIKGQAAHLDKHELHHLVNKVGDALPDTGEYTRKIYSALHDAAVGHIMKTPGGDDTLLHTLADHAVEHTDLMENCSYEHDMDLFGNHHPAMLSTNPRTIHSMIDKYHDISKNSNAIPYHDELSEDDKASLAYHVGKHADRKLAHDFHEDNQFTGKHYDHFVKGLNHNPDGESIQHSLTDKMHFGNVNSGVPSVDVHRYSYNGNSINTHTRLGAISIIHGHEHNDVRDGDLFNAIAEGSRHRSVLNKLATRGDIPDETKSLAVGQLPFANKKTIGESSMPSFDDVLKRVLRESFGGDDDNDDFGELDKRVEPIPNEHGVQGTMRFDDFVKKMSIKFPGDRKDIQSQEYGDEIPQATNYNQYGVDYVSEAVKKAKAKSKKKPARQQDDQIKPSAILINPDETEI